jgi:hypothetical protein
MVKFIDENRDDFGVEPICTTVEVARAGYPVPKAVTRISASARSSAPAMKLVG